jgi:hypothetical protein
MFPRVLSIALVLSNLVGTLHGQVFTDPGFESYSVNPGEFVQPSLGAWLFGNDAGVVEPPAPNSSTGPLNTWSAMFAPIDGQQYASTYAGADTIRQGVVFANPGDFRLSVYAAAPTGSVTIPSVGTFALGEGEFTFTLAGGAIGSAHTVPAGTGWSLFTADFTVNKSGTYQLGVRNTTATPYFINYDAFEIQPVPEPSTIALGLLGAVGIILGGKWRRRARRRSLGL